MTISARSCDLCYHILSDGMPYMNNDTNNVCESCCAKHGYIVNRIAGQSSSAPIVHDTPLSLSVGCLAYFDSFSGMVPCWIMAISGPSSTPSTAQRVKVKFTAKRGAYKRGEVYETFGLHIVPRGALRRGKVTTIKPYTFTCVNTDMLTDANG